jgi:hypothetical protein
MAYRLRITPFAQRHIDDFARYLRDYSEPFAREQIARLEHVLSVKIAGAPHTWSHFAFTGAPYRGYLFRVGRHTQYWIVYIVDDETKVVDVLHFWNAMRDPEGLEV